MIFKRLFTIGLLAIYAAVPAISQVADTAVDTFKPAPDTNFIRDTSDAGQSVPQANDSTPPATDTLAPRVHSPRKATLYSMALPGLGQVYNKKYWKVPVIYAGLGALVYMGTLNTAEYKRWHEAYLYKINQDTGGNELADKYDATQLKSQSDYYLRNVELTYILGSVLYILNMVDAAVDAHLFDYDISDDLSLRVNPEPFKGAPGAPTFCATIPPVRVFTLTWNF